MGFELGSVRTLLTRNHLPSGAGPAPRHAVWGRTYRSVSFFPSSQADLEKTFFFFSWCDRKDFFRTLSSCCCFKWPGNGAGKGNEIWCRPCRIPLSFLLPVFLIFLPVPMKSPREGSVVMERFQKRFSGGTTKFKVAFRAHEGLLDARLSQPFSSPSVLPPLSKTKSLSKVSFCARSSITSGTFRRPFRRGIRLDYCS